MLCVPQNELEEVAGKRKAWGFPAQIGASATQPWIRGRKWMNEYMDVNMFRLLLYSVPSRFSVLSCGAGDNSRHLAPLSWCLIVVQMRKLEFFPCRM